MIKEKDFDLIHREIDGMNSPEDSAKLKEIFARNPGAKDIYNDFQQLAELLNELPTLDPPENLKKQILNTIPTNKYAAQEKLSISRSPLPKFRFNFGYSFAFGILAGVIVTSLVFNKIKFVDTTNLSGTLLFSKVPEELQTGQSVEIKLKDIKGKVNLKYMDNIILAELNLNSQQPVEMAMVFNPDELVLTGFTHSREESPKFTGTNQELKLNHTGFQSYNFLFKKKSQSEVSIVIKLISNGIVVFEKKLSPTL